MLRAKPGATAERDICDSFSRIQNKQSECAAGLVAATEPEPLLFIWQEELQCLHRKEIFSFHQISLPHSRTPMIRYSS